MIAIADPQDVSHEVFEASDVALEQAGKRQSRRRSKRTTRFRSSSESIADIVNKGFADSGYPLKNIQCRYDGGVLVLTGFVSRYYHLQMAIETARALAREFQIQASINVFKDQTELRDLLIAD